MTSIFVGIAAVLRDLVVEFGIPVSLIISLIANEMAPKEIIAEYPDLEAEDIQQALRYAAWATDETVYIPTWAIT
jgi:uncharacterized protein (DUF433 family)